MGEAIVIGAGIGGLCAAIGLRLAGMSVTVLERAPGPAPVGAGITLWPNAVRSLGALGLGQDLRPLLAPQRSGGLRLPDGRVLTRVDGPLFERRYGLPMVGIHRARLAEILRSALPEGTVRYGVAGSAAGRDGQVCGAGRTARADLVVAADGIASATRSAVWPEHPAPEYCGVTAFRGVTAASPEAGLGGTLGPGTEFGIVPLAGGQRYWFASIGTPKPLKPADSKEFLREHLRGWHAEVRDIVERTPDEAILRHDLYALADPLPSYVEGRVALLGDAAHAMTPFLGQGGCQAIEDAVVLAACVAAAADLPAALAEYDARRRPRTQSIARASARMGRAGHLLRNPTAIAVRNTVLRLLPQSLSIRGADAIATWAPPRIDPHPDAAA